MGPVSCSAVTYSMVVRDYEYVARFFKAIPIARWTSVPLRLIVGFGSMEHGFNDQRHETIPPTNSIWTVVSRLY
jgi:hypothetical protein